jgi:hypothetical protein
MPYFILVYILILHSLNNQLCSPFWMVSYVTTMHAWNTST